MGVVIAILLFLILLAIDPLLVGRLIGAIIGLAFWVVVIVGVVLLMAAG